jgi:hypothetical protein
MSDERMISDKEVGIGIIILLAIFVWLFFIFMSHLQDRDKTDFQLLSNYSIRHFEDLPTTIKCLDDFGNLKCNFMFQNGSTIYEEITWKEVIG